MLVLIAVISALLFVGGVIAYWLVSVPLKELPNYQELMAAQVVEKRQKGQAT